MPLFNDKDKWQYPFTVFGLITGITERIRLHTVIFGLPQRPTVLTARQAAYVDILSKGRLCLAIGLMRPVRGWV